MRTHKLKHTHNTCVLMKILTHRQVQHALAMNITSVSQAISVANVCVAAKRSFYYYVSILAVLNFTEAVGSLLLYRHISNALWWVLSDVIISFSLSVIRVSFERPLFFFSSGEIINRFSRQINYRQVRQIVIE